MEYWKEISPCEGGKALAQEAQRRCGCPIPRSDQGQAGRNLEQLGVVQDASAHGRWSLGFLPTQNIPQSYELMLY